MHIAILTPVYVPAPGGAAEYTRLIAKSLASRSDVQRVSIFTEAFPGQALFEQDATKKIEIHRRFPFRAGRERRDMASFIAYAFQNLDFARISSWAPSDLDALLVHSSFHYNPTLLGFGLTRLRNRRRKSLRLVLDIRDPIMPRTASHAINIYDELICCSENAVAHIANDLMIKRPVHLVPIPFQPETPTPEEVRTTLDKYGLSNRRYLLCTNGTSLEKGGALCVEIAERLRARGHDVLLVIAGRRRQWGPIFSAAENAGILRCLGIVARQELLALMSGCAMHLNPSAIDGLSRGSLEAIALGARVLLPSRTPEFERCAPQFVMSCTDPEALTDQVEQILKADPVRVNYPLAAHDPEHVAAAYIEIIQHSSRVDSP